MLTQPAPTSPPTTQCCSSCTVPTHDRGDGLCTFCADYTPPAGLDGAASTLRLVLDDLRQIIDDLPADTPLFAVVDLVRARKHARAARCLVDRAAIAITAAAAAAGVK